MDRLRRASDDSDDLLRAAYLMAVLVALGGIGPWYSFDGVEILGTDGGNSGIYVIGLGLMAGLVLWSWSQTPGREKLVGVAICAGGALALLAVKANDVSWEGIGWGIWVGIAGAIALLLILWRLAVLNPA